MRAPHLQESVTRPLEAACPHAAITKATSGGGLPSARSKGNQAVRENKLPPAPSHTHLAHLSATTDTPIVYFTVCTHNRQALLNSPVAHEILRGIWSRSGTENGWYVGDYLLMPDHTHFFARPSRDADKMADWVKMWKSVSSRALSRDLELTSPIWQADYFDRFLRSDESYHDKWEYVNANPVRAGLVKKTDDWPYQGRICELRV